MLNGLNGFKRFKIPISSMLMAEYNNAASRQQRLLYRSRALGVAFGENLGVSRRLPKRSWTSKNAI